VENIRGDARLEGVFDNLRARLLARMKAGALELPLLPRVAMDVLALTSNENADTEELAELLHRDQSMTAHVLRIVNSPLYRTRNPIDSLPQALNRLGFARVREIAMVIACKQRVFRARDFGPEVYRAFRHSLATALFAQEVARSIHVDTEEAFLAGLLHDIGRPVLLQAVADLHAESRLMDTPAVMAVVAELHTQVGGLLARKWNLPERVCEAIAHHHEPFASPSTALPLLVNLADDLSAFANDSKDDIATTHWTLTHLNVMPEAFAEVLAQRPVLVQTMETLR
jgi:putative nucleotidyltransferase with HDIG domain